MKMSSDPAATTGSGKDKKPASEKPAPFVIKRSKFRIFANMLFVKKNATQKQYSRIRFFFRVANTLFFGAAVAQLYYMRRERFFHGYFQYFVEGVIISLACMVLAEWIAPLMKKRSTEMIRKISEQIRSASPDTHIDFPTWPEFVALSPSNMDTVSYACLGYLIGEQENNYEMIHEMADHLMKVNYTALPSFLKKRVDGKLMSFFSFRFKDPEQADFYYHRSRWDIYNDQDCNGRRRLAYYTYYVLGDVNEARDLVRQGLQATKVPDPLRTDYENALETKMLLYLKSQLDMASGLNPEPTDGFAPVKTESGVDENDPDKNEKKPGGSSGSGSVKSSGSVPGLPEV